jgi:uncharacterized membrane protein
MPFNLLYDISVIVKLGTFVDALGILIIVFGLVLSVLIFFKDWFKESALKNSYIRLRQNLGRAILLGLEFLVAGDIIRSVGGANPSFTSIGILGLIVIIRTFLSFTFELEVEGRWPWQKKSS